MINTLRNFRRDDRGAAAVEFVLAAPALILMLIGIAQLGILFMANAGLRNAVAEGARYATIYPRPSDTQIRDRVTNSRFGLTAANLQTPTVTHGVADGANYVDVTMNYNVPLDFIFFNVGTVTLSETRRAFIQPV